MPLNVGSKLGHYDVTAKIGEGGMGEVYRAQDLRSATPSHEARLSPTNDGIALWCGDRTAMLAVSAGRIIGAAHPPIIGQRVRLCSGLTR